MGTNSRSFDHVVVMSLAGGDPPAACTSMTLSCCGPWRESSAGPWGGVEWPVRPGEYLVVNPNDAANLSDVQKWPLRYESVFIGQSMLHRFREAVGLSRALGPFDFAPGPHPITGSVADALRVWRFASPTVGTPGDEDLTWLACRLLLHALLRQHPNQLRERWMARTGPTELARDPRMQAALAYIARHCDRPLVMAQVAREAGVGVDWLRKRFRATLRQSPKAYFLTVRMQRAKELLRDPTKTVEEVARAVGYSNTRAFYHAFSAYTQGTPSTFRAPTPLD